MIKKILPYVLVVLALWYFPDFYLFSKNASNYIYKEAIIRESNKVEVKVVRPISFFPKKYAVFNSGEKGLRVELVSYTKSYSRSVLVRIDEGTALFTDIPADTYYIHVGKEVNFFPEDFRLVESKGDSVFTPTELYPISLQTVTIKGDTFLAPIIQ